MPVIPITEEMLPSTTGAVRYPNPFFDLSNAYIPKNLKTLFKFCRTYFYTTSWLRNVVTKLTEYPITDITYVSAIDAQTKEKMDHILNEKLKIKSFLIDMGLDYFTMGNAFVNISMKPKRFLKCSVCGYEELIDNVQNVKLRNFEFFGNCKECKTTPAKMTAVDEYISSIENFRLHRWAPENIDIDYNPITGSAIYYYTIPQKVKTQIIAGNLAILKDIPLVFLESLKTKKKIIIDPENIFHFKAPTLAEDDMGWGKPLILPALKNIYYLQTLRRGNEAIVNEHIVPKKAVFPANTTSLDPFSQLNLGKWKGEIENTIKKWKIDPNYIAVFPIPMGYQELGGNAKMLMLTPEMKFIEEDIINSLGVPLEFIKGGASWTGSSISLRIVENHFLGYRELIEDFLNHFLIKKLNALLNIPIIKLKFKKFKMNDDSEFKQLALQLNASGKLSDATILEELGYDPVEEDKANTIYRDKMADEQINNQVKQSEAQGQAQVVLARYQVRSQKAMEQEQLKIQAELFLDELAQENAGIPDDPVKLIEKYTIELQNMPPEEANKRLGAMSQNMPITYSLVVQKLNEYQMNQMQQQANIMKGAAPENPEDKVPARPRTESPNKQDPGTREQDKVEIRDKEKTKGQTRGNP